MKFSIVEVNIFENYVQEILKSNLHPHKYAEGPIKGQLWDSHFLDNMCPVPSLDEILDVLLIFNMCVLAHVNSLLPFEIYNMAVPKIVYPLDISADTIVPRILFKEEEKPAVKTEKSARKRRLAVVDGGETPANFLFKNVKVFSFVIFRLELTPFRCKNSTAFTITFKMLAASLSVKNFLAIILSNNSPPLHNSITKYSFVPLKNIYVF